MTLGAVERPPLQTFAHAPDPMLPAPFRVGRVIRETHDTVTFDLYRDRGGEPLPFSPGQFNMLYAFGVGEVPISISGDPRRSDRFTHTLRRVGTVTDSLGRVKRNDVVGLRGPFGSHWPMETAVGNDLVIVAGGIGLAPLRPALYEICARRERYGRVSLLYGARTPADVLYAKEHSAWANKYGIRVATTVDRGTRDWKGPVGVVTTLIRRGGYEPKRTVAMICGPEVMSRFSIIELRKIGVRPEAIFVSMERNMKCAVGFCGHCQYGGDFICKDGPVLPYSRLRERFNRAEV